MALLHLLFLFFFFLSLSRSLLLCFFQVIRYGPDQRYTLHHDYFDDFFPNWDTSPAIEEEGESEEEQKAGGGWGGGNGATTTNRLLTFFIYLSDVEAGK